MVVHVAMRLVWLVFVSPVTGAASDQELARSLLTIERQANLVQQHPDSTSMEAQSAARTADALAPKLNQADPGLVRAVDEMATAARQLNRLSETRQRAIEVMERVRALRDASPGEE